jgi:hypothetical protein
MHRNETFALTWDPDRRYWQVTRNYVEQFMRDVADGSGTLTSPYALSPQYTDAGGRAGNSSAYGGGCIDFGGVGGASCKFGTSNGDGPGHNYPANGCPVSGMNNFAENPDGSLGTPVLNDVCLTDAQLQGELAAMVNQSGMLGHTKSGYSPLVTVLVPAGVEVCLDSGGKLCSANGNSTAQFCSYHSQLNVGGTEVPYVVQPWTSLTNCDDPDIDAIPNNVDVVTLAKDIGMRLVSPLSQAQLGAVTNPALNGWFALDGSEMNDNGCLPEGDAGNKLDSALVGSSSQNPYMLQREFNNAGVIESDPDALRCMPSVLLSPQFVVPSAVKPGDVVEFDGSTTISTLIVPKGDYAWSFGDGTSAVGASVVHTYAAGGTYPVKLTVTDRGGNVQTITQTITVAGGGGSGGSGGDGGSGKGKKGSSSLHVHLQLMPQGLHAVLHSGLAIKVTSNQPADAIATLSIPRKAAKRAHMKVRHGSAVVIGRGTISGIKDGTVSLRLHLSRSTTSKLKRLRHVSLTVRLALVGAGGARTAVDAAGRY